MIVFHYSTIYLLTYRNGLYLHVDGIFVALAPVLVSEFGSLPGGGCPGGGGGGGGGGVVLGLQGLYSATNCCRYNDEQTTKQTKAINNSYIYIYHVNVTQTVPDISPLMPMHQDPLLVSLHWGQNKMAAIYQTTFSNTFYWMKMHEFRLRFHWSLFLRVQLTIFQYWFR